MSDLYSNHIDFCERCFEIREDESLTEEQRNEKMYQCFKDDLDELAEMDRDNR